MNEIEKQLDIARKDLLDLTLRNRLLNFKPLKSRTITITGPAVDQIGQTLVSNESYFGFSSDTNGDEPSKQMRTSNGRNSSSRSSNSHSAPTKKLGHFLQTTLNEENLQRMLLKIYRQSAEVLAEQGYSILFLSLGQLKWSEADHSQEFHSAPLILAPVELERQKIGEKFRLRWTGEEVLTNISLQGKLTEQNVQLPELELNEDSDFVTDYFEAVKAAISKKTEWEILPECYLDFFSFTKFIMFKDLDSSAWPDGTSPADHPLMQAIFGKKQFGPDNGGFQENQVDEKLRMRDVFHVWDADPSQIAVIEDVKAGGNLVVEGPPGTGKSQTITNLVAELLAMQKSVLFISEKMAALEVVKRRLDEAKLGDFCLELHSRKASKKEVLKELDRTLNLQSNYLEPPEYKYGEVDQLRKELNSYARALSEPIGHIAVSPFELFATKEKTNKALANKNRVLPQLEITSPDRVTKEQLQDAERAVTNLADTLAEVGSVQNNPWYPTKPDLLLPLEIEKVGSMIVDCEQILLDLDSLFGTCEAKFGICKPRSLNEVEVFYNSAELLADVGIAKSETLSNPKQEAFREFFNNTISLLESYQLELGKLPASIHSAALDGPIQRILSEYTEMSSGFFHIFSKGYRSIKKQIASLYTRKMPFWRKQIISDLQQVVFCIAKREEIRGMNTRGHEYFGPRWQDDKTDPTTLKNFLASLEKFKESTQRGSLNRQAVVYVSAGVDHQELMKETQRVRETVAKLVKIRDEISRILNIEFELVFRKPAQEVLFSDLTSRLRLWIDARSRLHSWSNFVVTQKKCKESIAEPIARLVEVNDIVPGDLLPLFQSKFADSLLNVAFAQRPSLSQFQGAVHEKRIDRFRTLDGELITLNRSRLAAKLARSIPRLQASSSKGSEAGILLSEINKNRRHKPIRKLMTLAGGLIQKIKPCFMMSPLSVAQFLDPRTVKFDVVIFDEGSQVKPADALGSILRGNQLVVAGDSKQLPPTSFFDHVLENVEEEDEDSDAFTSDMESILRLCKVRFPVKMLRWHYRSRHESLIAVSNQEFYNNKLLIYPSALGSDDNLGLQFKHLPHSVYDRGRSSVNRIEAQEVATAAIDHFKHFPKASLGIGTFNIRQQQAILDEVDNVCRNHPDLEIHFSRNGFEPFFVKNLETIQGDERDVIFLSVGFGKDSDGKLGLNFGPLNQQGGERRLNVLVTRARQRCVVFSNFKAQDMPLGNDSSVGVRCLKVFLEYAETKNLTELESDWEDPDSPFEEAVADFVREQGFQVRKQVGCAGFRVDLGVVDPHSPGRYLLGIECDGAKYHSSTVARDRDRLRQHILEQKGWTIHRVWSTDWYRSTAHCKELILKALNKAKWPSEIKGKQTPKPVSQKDAPKTPIKTVTPVKTFRSKPPAKEPVERPIPYKKCTNVGIYKSGELHQQSPWTLAEAVKNVVHVESPVHPSEVTVRIRDHWELKRAGGRIQSLIDKAIEIAMAQDAIKRRNGFLWTVGDNKIQVRDRTEAVKPNIDLICDEELSEAVNLVLRRQFATSREDLVTEAARLLGFHSTRTNISDRINIVIEKSIKARDLQITSNGMIDLPNGIRNGRRA